MNIKHFLLLAISIFSLQCNCAIPHIMVVIPSYNNQDYYQKNLSSLFEQDYPNFDIIYIDDCSPDGTGQLVRDYVAQHNWQDRCMVISNPVRCLQLRNTYWAIHTFCEDDDIVVICDGDDWFARPDALSIIAQQYHSSDVWVTYGNFKQTGEGQDWRCRMPREQRIKQNKLRQLLWLYYHPRTFYASLFKQIKIKDLLREGSFIPMAADQAYFYPLLEMSGGRFNFIQDVLYVYNRSNPINCYKINGRLQSKCCVSVVKKKPYTPLAQRPSKCRSPELPKVCTIVWPEQKALLQTITDNDTYDYCVLVNDLNTSFDTAQAIEALTQTNAYMCVVADVQSSEKQNVMKHCSYITDRLYVFQLGWQPELPWNYTPKAIIMPMHKALKYQLQLNNLITNNLQIAPPTDNLKEKAGLVVVG